MAQETISEKTVRNTYAPLVEIFANNNNDVVLAARELTYENKRETLISIVDARKVFTLISHIMSDKASDSDLKVYTGDLDRILQRTGVLRLV